MRTETSELMQQLGNLRNETARDLSAILRDLEAVRVAFNGVLKRHTGVSALPGPQMYVLGYRDDTGQSRVAVIRSVIRQSDGSFSMYTASGATISLVANQIDEWDPVLHRTPDPLPSGWWR